MMAKPKNSPSPAQRGQETGTYPAGMEQQRGEPQGLGRQKPGPKNPPEAATVEDDEDER